ncbi:helix-turn-helix domain-containing protein [Kitasatospora sp. NPDC089913]|uniref:helix-turn-helix domain-containing protein n=1 Tax=Kitasatospora sp. NPDC089913 TaxID=3364080 RepID=UPI00382A08E9
MTTTAPEDTPEYDPTLVALRVEEAARRLSIGRTTMYALIRDGEIETIPIGRARRVPAEAVIEFTRRRMQQHATTPIAA